MKPSNIGGQAVIEGIMMRNKERYAVAVRKPDNEIAVETSIYNSFFPWKGISKVPFLRGIVAFIDAFILSMKTMTFAASFFEYDDEEDEDNSNVVMKSDSEIKSIGLDTGGNRDKGEDIDEELREKKRLRKERNDKIFQGIAMTCAIIIALGVFIAIPTLLSGFLRGAIESRFLIAFLEGVIRLSIVIGYILLVSRMREIRRTFMYHGAEHKCINCIEHGHELTFENVKENSIKHKRCGTSFIFFVVVVSIFFSFFTTADSQLLRVLIRLAVFPFIAGVSFEIIRLAGQYDNWFLNLLSQPGMLMQKLTTKEPDDDMIEVAIVAVEEIFDWREFQGRSKADSEYSVNLLTDCAGENNEEAVEHTKKNGG